METVTGVVLLATILMAICVVIELTDTIKTNKERKKNRNKVSEEYAEYLQRKNGGC